MIDQPTGTVIAALIAFLGGLWAANLTYQQKGDELFFKALDFLGGGSQRRNLGISAIELYWNSKRHRPICVSLLVGSALYLLLESKNQEKIHEINNLLRMMDLLLFKNSISGDAQFKQYLLLKNAVEKSKLSTLSTGLAITTSQRDDWLSRLEEVLRSHKTR
jgi:hypothetical protein